MAGELSELRQHIRQILTHKPMLKIVMRMKDAAGTKPEEVSMPWQPYQLQPSDKTLDDIMDAVLTYDKEKYNKRKVPAGVYPGLYKVYWREGGSSVAAVGCDRAGRLWLAPTNWITVPTFNWEPVLKVERYE